MRANPFRSALASCLLMFGAFLLALPVQSRVGGLSGAQMRNNDRSNRWLRQSAPKAISYRSPGAFHKSVIPNSPAAQALLAEKSGIKSKRYESFIVVEMSNEALVTLNVPGVQLRDDFNVVFLKCGQLDTNGPDPYLPIELRQVPHAGHSLQLAQLFGPPTPESVRSLRKTGAKVLSYIPNNSYLLWATPSQLQRVRLQQAVQWVGEYHPAYKLDPGIDLTSEQQVQVSIELLDDPESEPTLANIRSIARAVLLSEYRINGFVQISVLIDSFALAELARSPALIGIERWARPQLMDERANQIVAGALAEETVNNVRISKPSRPGFLSFLNSAGLSSPFDFALDVADSGFDIGSDEPGKMHSDFLDSSGASRFAYVNDYTSDAARHGGDASVLPAHDPAGHGTLNASIAAGFNDQTGSTFRDALGYQYGLGIAPYARLGISKIFDDNLDFQQDRPLPAVYSSAYSQGARISSNSWGACDALTGFCNLYTGVASLFDSLVRDVSPPEFGNQSMIFVFAAGNDGEEAAATISSPATAKNVITVGASESFRPSGPDGQPATDGCRVQAELANNAMEVVHFSSAGPVQDGRFKPDLVAPGTHIQGAATQDRFYASRPLSDIGLCDRFFPSGQTRYTWSSGTSHATPIVAGGAALAFQWLKAKLGHEPSPALVKALILNSTTYVTGTGGGDSLPGTRQGWGLLNLARMLEATDRILYDESSTRTFTTSGGSPFEITGTITDPLKEFRVMLAWTDAPGNPATNAPYVNQLNLEVSIAGTIYSGNHFSGQYSTAGGEADILNNVQGIRLPAGTTGPFVIRVRPTVIAGDGVPNNFIDLDQDFAIVVTNGRETPLPLLSVPEIDSIADGISVRHSNGVTDSAVLPGENVSLTVRVRNDSASTAANITSATLTLAGVSAVASFPVIGPASTASNTTPFDLRIPSDLRCGSTAVFQLALATGQVSFSLPVRVRVGRSLITGPQTLLNDDVDAGSVRWKAKRSFTVSNGAASSGTRSYHAVDPGRVDQDSELSILMLKKPIALPQNAGGIHLSFLHIFNFEPGFDGGVLEISADDGTTWQDLGSRIVVGEYDGKVTSASNNPLGSRFAWTSRGRPGVFSRVVINLDDFAGQRIRLRFLAGFDESVGILDGYAGWFIDDIRITTGVFECR